MKTNIWWIRRDLRLFDNSVLADAVNNSDNIIPIFILDPAILHSTRVGKKRLAFLYEGLSALDENLKARGAKIVIRSGEPGQVFSQITREIPADEPISIYCEEDYTPYAQKRDEKINQNFRLIKRSSPSILSPGIILKSNKTPYSVYTPYKNSWYSIASFYNYQPTPIPERICIPSNIESLPIPKINDQSSKISASESSAQSRMDYFFSGEEAPIFDYTENRDIPLLDGTSKLSPYLRFGMLSPRYLFSYAQKTMQECNDAHHVSNVKSWLDEMVWRDFYMQILFYFPQVINENFRHKHIQWLNDKNSFESWCNGLTGFPIIDAAMRQLINTGWMHNRLRMIVASFLTKNLLIDWRWGEAFFMQHLIDGDLASNNGGWQWCASTGTDAVPYFRIFNPIAQSKKIDPHGTFIRSWIPELVNVDNKFIHEPWLMSLDEQNRKSCHIGKEYPFPIVDLKKSRYRALDVFIK